MSSPQDEEQFAEPKGLRHRLESMEMGSEPSAQHDTAILAAAHALAGAAPRRRWFMPMSVAASFLVGSVLTFALLRAPTTTPGRASTPAALYVPAAALTRGGVTAAGDRVPVEKADPAEWYRYIEGLLASGQREEAARQLQRFNELHPDYVHQP